MEIPKNRARSARKSDMAAILIGLGLVGLLWTLIEAGTAIHDRQETRSLVSALGLSDLALFTEARYTRHPAMADLHSAFQDHPMSLDHFPSGSLIQPPSLRDRP